MFRVGRTVGRGSPGNPTGTVTEEGFRGEGLGEEGRVLCDEDRGGGGGEGGSLLWALKIKLLCLGIFVVPFEVSRSPSLPSPHSSFLCTQTRCSTSLQNSLGGLRGVEVVGPPLLEGVPAVLEEDVCKLHPVAPARPEEAEVVPGVVGQQLLQP